MPLEFKILLFVFLLVLIIALMPMFIKALKDLDDIGLKLPIRKEKNLSLSNEEEKAFRDFLINCKNCTSSYFEFVLNEKNFIYHTRDLYFKQIFNTGSEKVSISQIKKEFIKHQRATNTIENIDLEINKLHKSITDYEILEKDILVKFKENK